jgi:hypothetical protein
LPSLAGDALPDISSQLKMLQSISDIGRLR